MKKNKNLNLVLIGLVISLFGSAIQRFSFSLYLLDLTQNAAIFSNVMAVSVLPFILLAPLSGMAADHFNKKKIMVVLDLMSATVIGAYLLITTISTYASGGTTQVMSNVRIEVILTAVVMFLLSAISSFYTPAVTAMIPLIVADDKLMKANAKVSQIGSIANLAGPVLAGVIYGLLGIKGVTLLNGISFLGSAILELFIVYHHEERKHTKEQDNFTLRASITEMKESFLYLKQDKPVVLQFINSYCMFNLCLVPTLTILLPYMLRSRIGISSEAYGIVEGMIAAGMIVGAAAVSTMPKKFPIHKIYRWDYLLVAATGGMMLSSTGHSVIVIWTICGFLIMAALGIGNVVTLSHTQQIIDTSHLGKVSAYSTAVATISVPIGQMLFGWYISFFSNVTLLLGIVVLLNLGITWYLKRAVRSQTYHI